MTDDAMIDDQAPEDSSHPDDVTLLSQAREEFKAIDLREKHIREEYDRCTSFLALQHWSESAAAARGTSIPSLTVDHLGPIVAQVKNDWIRNKVAIDIAPADEIASEETAEVLEGWVRNVQYLSQGQTHFDTAFGNMCGGNRGYVGVLMERLPGTRRMQAVIRGFPDSQAVYMGFFKRPDQMDLDHAFYRDSMSTSEFKRQWPDAAETDFTEWGADFSDWYAKDMVSVAEYWKLRYKPRKIHFLQRAIRFQRDGKPIESDTIYSDELRQVPQMPQGFIVQSDDEPKREVWQYVITGKEVLQRTLWPGKIIPIVPMWGRTVVLKGKTYLFSVISASLDSQRMVDYAESGVAEQMASTVHTPYIGATGTFKSRWQDWQKSAVKRFPFLEYDIVPLPGGGFAPPPSRQPTEPEIGAYLAASDHAAQNVRLTSGINKSSLGIDDSQAKSGIAKKLDVAEGDNSTYDFHASGARALEVVGNILVDIAPKLVTDGEIVQILDDQDKQKSVLVGADVANAPNAPKGQDVSHFLDRGEYRVRVSAAPSHQTMREETQSKLAELYAELPPGQKEALTAPFIRSLDINGKDELAERVELPQFQKPKDDQPAIPPEVQQLIQHGQQVKQELEAEVARLTQERDTKLLDLETKKQIAAMNNETQLAIAEINKQVSGFEISVAHMQKTLDMMLAHSQMEQDSMENEAGRAHEIEKQAQAAMHSQTEQMAGQQNQPQQGGQQQ